MKTCEEELAAVSTPTRRNDSGDRKTPREIAEAYAYRAKEGHLYLPGAAIARALREAGGAHKAKGRRRKVNG